MPSDRKPSLILPATVTIAVLLAAYIRSYYATVEVKRVVAIADASKLIVMEPEYRGLGDTVGQILFAPMHWIDLQLRPEVWADSIE
jgi:hypothetical protein